MHTPMVVKRASAPTPPGAAPLVSSAAMEPDDGFGDDERPAPLLPPDDRLWRHPSEVAAHGLPSPVRRRRQRHRLATALGAVAVVVAAGVGVTLVAGGTARRAEPFVPLSTTSFEATADGGELVRHLAGGIDAALVALDVEGGRGPGMGSGVVFRSDGHVLTAAHVVAGATRITAVTADGRRQAAELVAWDAGTDLAVVKLARRSVLAAPLGDDRALAVGQKVAAAGRGPAPGATWTAAATVRAVGRHVERSAAEDLLDMIEIDTALPAAAVGGALVDARGAVVAITTSAPGAASSGLATPIRFARHVAERLVASGRVARAWLGIEGRDLDGPTAARLGVDGGVVVGNVRDGSPAQRSGLAPGDVLTAVDGTAVTSMTALKLALRWHDPGDSVVATVLRGGQARVVRVELAERPPAA